jgi:hypothetical protein
MRWRLGWLAALLMVACSAPAAAPSLPPTATIFASNPQEPWRLTATAEAAAAPRTATALQDAQAAREATRAAHWAAVEGWQQSGEFGLAIEEMKVWLTVTPLDRGLRTTATAVAQAATRAVPTQRAGATQTAQARAGAAVDPRR